MSIHFQNVSPAGHSPSKSGIFPRSRQPAILELSNYQLSAAAYFADFFGRLFGRIISGESFDVALLECLAICEEKAAVLKNLYSSKDPNSLRNVDLLYTRKPIRTTFWKRVRTRRILPCSLPLRLRSAAERIW